MTETWTKERLRLMEDLHEKGYRNKLIHEALNMLPGAPLSRGAFAGKYWRAFGKQPTLAKKIATAEQRNQRRREKRKANPDQARLDNEKRRKRRAKARGDQNAPRRKINVLQLWEYPTDRVFQEYKPRKIKTRSHHKTILELKKRQCRWPDDEPNSDGWHTFCGCRTYDGSSYCEKHLALNFSEGTPSERAAHKVGRRELG